jgi:ubiquitin carboxyl-terminal hydrolase 36/42
MVQSIRRVGKQFRPHRQEDAHEYLRQLLDCMHEEILKANNVKISDGKVAETTLISRVFGGSLRNELKCLSCRFSSKTYNHFQDLSLEISGGISSGDFIHKKFILTV